MIVFDTDVISFVLRPRPPTGLIGRIGRLDPSAQATTSINVGELVYGAWRSSQKERYLKAINEHVLPNIVVLPFDFRAAIIFGETRAVLEKEGISVSEPDLRIAAICLSKKAVLATGNLRHFSKIPGLDVEDWLAPFR
ncbi:MAG: type II toxin-antitoxin system VapC family toxin [Myxococcota bacterium]|nr:type II toxin-antitoxin system VapC family toxin [Myxococcota bacterium]